MNAEKVKFALKGDDGLFSFQSRKNTIELKLRNNVDMNKLNGKHILSFVIQATLENYTVGQAEIIINIRKSSKF